MPGARAEEFGRAALRLGFERRRQTGSHERWIHQDGRAIPIRLPMPIPGSWEARLRTTAFRGRALAVIPVKIGPTNVVEPTWAPHRKRRNPRRKQTAPKMKRRAVGRSPFRRLHWAVSPAGTGRSQLSCRAIRAYCPLSILVPSQAASTENCAPAGTAPAYPARIPFVSWETARYVHPGWTDWVCRALEPAS